MMLVLISMTFSPPLFLHPLEVICTNCINLMLQPDQEVILFSIRAINYWNKLPDYIVTAQTLNGLLDDFLFEQMIYF